MKERELLIRRSGLGGMMMSAQEGMIASRRMSAIRRVRTPLLDPRGAGKTAPMRNILSGRGRIVARGQGVK